MNINKTYVYGFEPAIRGMRNAKNSWNMSDSSSHEDYTDNTEHLDVCNAMLNDNVEKFRIGEKDLKLAQTLILAGTEHCKFMRQIQVWCNITAPRYWWSEFDTYKIGASANSTSTMHKLFDKKTEITLNMFESDDYTDEFLPWIIEQLNRLRETYFEVDSQTVKDELLLKAKRILPESYLNMRTVNMNYATIRNILMQRKHHRLKLEWQEVFCKWVTRLSYSKELIFCGMEDEYERLKSL